MARRTQKQDDIDAEHEAACAALDALKETATQETYEQLTPISDPQRKLKVAAGIASLGWCNSKVAPEGGKSMFDLRAERREAFAMLHLKYGKSKNWIKGMVGARDRRFISNTFSRLNEPGLPGWSLAAEPNAKGEYDIVWTIPKSDEEYAHYLEQATVTHREMTLREARAVVAREFMSELIHGFTSGAYGAIVKSAELAEITGLSDGRIAQYLHGGTNPPTPVKRAQRQARQQKLRASAGVLQAVG